MLLGIVGKPSCGKSTFFKAATLAEAEIANYPFTTIKPNSGIGYVKVEDAAKFFGMNSNPREGYAVDGKRFVPVQMLDVAGLVPGAHEGKGMGSQFLDDLRQADVFIHVIDISGSVNANGEPVEPLSYDPLNDVTFLEDELNFWILGLIKKGWEKFARTSVSAHEEAAKAVAKYLSGLGVTEDHMKEILKGATKPLVEWNEDDLLKLATDVRLKTKPMLIACNKIDVPGAEKNLIRLKEAFPSYEMIPCSAESELALKEAAKHGLIHYVPGGKSFEIKDASKLSDKQKKALDFIKANILDTFGSTGVQDVLDIAVFRLLRYKAIFPGGVNKLADSEGRVLPDCFLMPPKTTALDFAFRLHTDFGNKFIRAIDVKKKLPIGKDHILQNGDVVEIVADR